MTIRITFPLTHRMRGDAVADLQDALLKLVDNGGLRGLSVPDRLTLKARLHVERQQSVYGDATRQLVGMFQQEEKLGLSGLVDELTAKALNVFLGDVRGKDDARIASEGFLVAGRARREDDLPFSGSLVRAFHADSRGMLRLGEDTTDDEGRFTIRCMPLPGVDALRIRVVAYDANGKSLAVSDLQSQAKSVEPVEIIDLTVPVVDNTLYVVDGTVSSRAVLSVGGLSVVLVDKSANTSVEQEAELAKTTTADDGTYRVTFPGAAVQRLGKPQPDLQARVFSAGTLLGESSVVYGAPANVTLNVELRDVPLHSEHEALTSALRAHFDGDLLDVEESDARQDITYLANKSGWDARAVALAALADRFSADTATLDSGRIQPEVFYALFRAGLPANESILYQTGASTVKAVVDRAVDQGVIAAVSDAEMLAALEGFRVKGAQQVLEGGAFAGLSSLQDMLSVSFGNDDPQSRQQFADLYTRHRDDPQAFWQSVQTAFGEPMEKRLRLDGQLAFLTLNNAPLVGKLHAAEDAEGLRAPVDLVAQGYYRAAKWEEAIGDGEIPDDVPGADQAERKARYAELMAAHVRISFPTAVVAAMVKADETPVAPLVAEQVHDFLLQHQGAFEIGMQPVQQFVAKSGIAAPETVVKEVERIQRVYQITSSDEAMNVLLRNDLHSAAAIVRHDRDQFVGRFADQIGGEEGARLIYAKAQQVYSTVLNLAVSYATATQAPAIGAHSAPQIIAPAPAPPPEDAPSDIIAYTTLTELIGSSDFCECDHCRSILSPAAYLVDLLLFCDRPVNEQENPQTVLLRRRPDIAYLPLTCENTNTQLPYIDLVNETLEYFVANVSSLAGYEGHSSDSGATPEELLADPQFVSDKAYELLAGRAVNGGPPPLLPAGGPLPFHRPLETLRRLFAKFEASLPEVMEALRKNESIERAAETDYAWRDILMEEIGFSRAEYKQLTDPAVTLRQLYGFPAAVAENELLAELSNAKAYARRMGVSYEELIAILRTRFVNPGSMLIPKLERLGVSLGTLKALKDGTTSNAEFDAALAPHVDASQYGGDVKAWVRNDANFARIMGLLILTDPDAVEDVFPFDKLVFRYADPALLAVNVRPFEFVRLFRFIRLWKKLGWTIEETDKAITALYPAAQTPNDADDAVNLQRLSDGLATLLPRLGIVKRVMRALKLKREPNLLPLLACFAPLDVHGPASLYRRMFSPALQKEAPAFAENVTGEFLTGDVPLLSQAAALRAAFQLTGEELDAIVVAARIAPDARLSLENVSTILRYGWLARKLRLSVQEFVLLVQCTGIDPFATPDPPSPGLGRFVAFVQRLRALSLKPASLLYQVWNADVSGKSAPAESDVAELARALRRGFAAIESELALVEDPDGQLSRSRMGLVYGNETAERFFGLLHEVVVTEVAYTHPRPTLEQALIDAAKQKIAYDNLRKRLAFTGGVMSDAVRDALKGVAGVPQAFQDAVDALHKSSRSLFLRHPELAPLHDQYVTSPAPPDQRRAALMEKLLPELKRRRKRQQALQIVSAAARTDVVFGAALLDDATVLHAAGDAARPALDDMTGIEQSGLSAEWFFRSTATGAVDRRRVEAKLSFTELAPNNGSVVSVIFNGFLEAPANGFYNIRVVADADARAVLSIGGNAVAVSQVGQVWSNQAPIELVAGVLHPFRLVVENTKETLTVQWESEGGGIETIPAGFLYASTLVDVMRGGYLRFLKSASLAASLKITAAELVHVTVAKGSWLNRLPVEELTDAAALVALYDPLSALLEFARLKAAVSRDDERLLAVLKAPADPAGPLFAITRWEPVSLDALLTRFGHAGRGALGDIAVFARVFDAYAWAKKLGVPAAALLSATTNEPGAATVRDLQSALRARYSSAEWLDVLKPINDELRSLRRDALVAYILHQMRFDPGATHIDTPEKLFEFFLMDVQMEPCMQTSRIRHALSSVQLFIERCLMNLERNVAPSSINAKQWEWMSRYRVWEANRKVFLYPENWLEPELRDDQSPFFKETIGELLQGDVTDDRAATALLNYLGKLEEVARLEPCGIHYAENQPGAADDVVHVVARTSGANRKYFYRRKETGSWSPWEQIRLEIEDNPVLPVVWRNRLFLFWLRILKAAPPTSPTIPEGGLTGANAAKMVPPPTAEVQAILCWSEYFNGKWQPARTADPARPASLGSYAVTGDDAFKRSNLTMSVMDAGSSLLILCGSALFTLHNPYSVPEFGSFFLPFFVRDDRIFDLSKDTFAISYYKNPFNNDGSKPIGDLPRKLFRNRIVDQAIAPRHPVSDVWDAPFFYYDNRHVFYVTTAERVVLVREWETYMPPPVLPPPTQNVPPIVIPPPIPVPIPRDVDPPRHQGPGKGHTFSVPRKGLFEEFVATDPNISRAIAAEGTVRFGTADIGARGMIKPTRS